MKKASESEAMRFWSKVNLTANDQLCWNWTACRCHGYGYMNIEGKLRRAHRVAWFYVKGVWPTLNLLHSCDNKSCVNPNHLREGTIKDNSYDAIQRGQQVRGERVGTAKLTQQEVLAIRQIYKDGGVPQYVLAEQFGISQSSVSRLVRYENWQHI